MFFRKSPDELLITAQSYARQNTHDTVCNNIEKAKKLIDQGANVNFVLSANKCVLARLDSKKNSYEGLIGETILMSYAESGCAEMVEYILQHGGDRTINTRKWGLINLHSYCAQETEGLFTKETPHTNDGYRFESALSLAFASTQTHDGKVIEMLLNHGTDLSLFYDNEFYRPVLFSSVGKLDDTRAYIRPECRRKVEMILKKMMEENLHLTVCKEAYQIFSAMLSEQGYEYKIKSQSKTCVIS